MGRRGHAAEHQSRAAKTGFESKKKTYGYRERDEQKRQAFQEQLKTRSVTGQQFWIDNGKLCLRDAKDLPPVGKRSDSPYDPQERYGNKRSSTWTGYKVHLTETCDAETMHLVTNVITSTANIPDIEQTKSIHQRLKTKKLLPQEHFADAGYVDSGLLIDSRKDYGIALIGPMRPNGSWQTKVEGSYDLSQFRINWNTKQVTCPQGKKSRKWIEATDTGGNRFIHVRFLHRDCRDCPVRTLCTRSATEARALGFRPKQSMRCYRGCGNNKRQPATTLQSTCWN